MPADDIQNIILAPSWLAILRRASFRSWLSFPVYVFYQTSKRKEHQATNFGRAITVGRQSSLAASPLCFGTSLQIVVQDLSLGRRGHCGDDTGQCHFSRRNKFRHSRAPAVRSAECHRELDRQGAFSKRRRLVVRFHYRQPGNITSARKPESSSSVRINRPKQLFDEASRSFAQ